VLNEYGDGPSRADRFAGSPDEFWKAREVSKLAVVMFRHLLESQEKSKRGK
jgi:hypothetical protein